MRGNSANRPLENNSRICEAHSPAAPKKNILRQTALGNLRYSNVGSLLQLVRDTLEAC
jgi:hypothetical protein